MLTHHRLYTWVILVLLAAACSDKEPAKPAAQPDLTPTIEAPDPVYPKRALPYINLIDSDLGNPSWFAGLIDTESRYDQFAVSPRGAIGLTQIMPSNHEWLENSICRSLGKAKPEDPAWQVTCGQMLFEWGESWRKNPPPLDYCDTVAMKSLLFNGGYYAWWEFDAGGGTINGGKAICGKKLPNGRKRSKSSCHENYNYPVTIGKKQQLFSDLGGQQCVINF